MIFREGSLRVGYINGLLLAIPFWVGVVWLLLR